MPKGRLWTRGEDDLLRCVFEERGNTLLLAAQLGLTHLALFDRAKRIGITDLLIRLRFHSVSGQLRYDGCDALLVILTSHEFASGNVR